MKKAITNRCGKGIVCRKWVCKCRPVRCKWHGCCIKKKKRQRYGRNRKRSEAKPSVAAPRLPAFTVHPIVKRYFFIPTADISLTEEVFLRPGQFVDDEGEPAESFPSYHKEGYYNLFVNGVLQEGQLYAVASEAIRLTPTGQVIRAGSPIILESVGFVVQIA